QGGGGDAFHCRDRLAGAEAATGRTVDHRRRKAVVAHDGLWPLDKTRLGQRANRHHGARRAADIDAVDVVDGAAKARLGLDVDLPGPAEQVEVVDIDAAQGRLQRGEDVAHLDAQ